MTSSRTYRHAYFDCFHGISGDMTLGALVDAGVPLAYLKRELAKIPVEGYSIRSRKVMKGAIACRKVDVIQKGLKPGQGKGRHLPEIHAILRKSRLEKPVVERIKEAFHHLAVAEAAVHGTTIDKIHFHEVGAIDAIVDIAGAMIGFARLGVESATSAPVPVGSGQVDCRHGTIPIPGPATLEILRGCPVKLATEDTELTTPTGAAILVTLCQDFGPPPAMTIGSIGLGAGDRPSDGLPNALRLVLGDPIGASPSSEGGIFQLETNVDDATPEILGHALEQLLAAGALDAWVVPIQMKKSRPGAMLCALAQADRLDAVRSAYFRETTTFGVRCFPVERAILDRETRRVKTRFGAIDVKVGLEGKKVVTVSPEFESCRRAAERAGKPLREVFEEARRSFTNRR